MPVQAVHAEVPSAAAVLAWQVVQTLCPVPALNLPAGQLKQNVLAVSDMPSLKVPAAQNAHVDTLVTYWPAGQ